MPNDPLKLAIKGTTQEHLPIEDILDDVVILKDGSAVSVLRVSSVNFDLLSEKEQMSLVVAYGGILNSLNFPVQIIIKSGTKDISAYMKRLIASEGKQTNKMLKERIKKYREFIEEIVKRNDVLSKSFYVVVKFSSLELGIKSAGKQGLMALIRKSKNTGLPYPKNYILEKAKASLEPKKDHLIRLFSRLGLEISSLNTKELTELFYRLYNPEVSDNQKLKEVNYYSPMVTTK